MGRGLISDELINQVRDRVDIAEIVGHHVSLSRTGQNLKGLCPFHQEKTPSFTVSPSRQIFHCFGCGAGGNVFSFLMRITGAGFPETVRDIGRRVGIEVPESGGVPDRQAGVTGRLEQVNAAAAAWFRRNLLDPVQGKDGRDYLTRRGIMPNTAETYRLGFAPAEWDGLVKALGREGYGEAELAAAGLAVARDQGMRGRQGASGSYDRFRGRLMCPITDLRKRVVGFGGRVFGDEQPKYLNSPDTPLFKKGQTLFGLDLAREATTRLKTLIVVEGYFDVIALHQAGMLNVAATLGTALTSDHVQVIRRFASKVVLLFDPDPAGVRAALRTLDLFVNSGLGVVVVTLPDGDDPDTFVRQRGAEAFMRLLEKAPSLLDFALEQSLKDVQGQTVEDKVRSVDEVLRILHKSSHPIEREERIRIVAERLGISQQRLIDRYPTLVEQDRKRGQKRGPLPAADTRSKGSPEERELLHLLLHGKLSPADLRRLSPGAFVIPACRRIVEEAGRHLDRDGRVQLRPLLDAVVTDPDCGSLVTELSLLEQHYDDVQAHIGGCMEKLERKRRERVLRELIEKLKAAEREGRGEDARLLNVQVNELRQRKAGGSMDPALVSAAKE